MDRINPPPPNEASGIPHDRIEDERDRDAGTHREELDRALPDDAVAGEAPNPPHTTTGKITAPKFGSAGSGGAEIEPGPERD